MKRCVSIVLATLLLLGLVGCGDQGSPSAQSLSAQSTPAEQAPTQDGIVAAYDIAAKAYDWFDLTTMPLDNTDTKKVGEDVYNRVDQPGITSMAQLKEYLNTLFTPELTESLLEESQDHYRDMDGLLYARSADRGTDIHLQGKRVTAAQRDDAHWDVTLTFYAGYRDNSASGALQVTIGYSQTVLDYEKTDVGWRFATFCPLDNLDETADTVYTFSYDLDTFDHTDFDKFGDFELCCYFLNSDGAFTEMSDVLALRFLKNPERVMKSLVMVEESPWEHKDAMISLIGYDAVYFPMKKMDFPAEAACSAPKGVNTPWLMALFRKRTFAGSTRMDVRGRSPRSTSQPTPAPITALITSATGPITQNPIIARMAARMPAEKLLTSISKPAGIFSSTQWSKTLITQPPSGPIIMPSPSVGTS